MPPHLLARNRVMQLHSLSETAPQEQVGHEMDRFNQYRVFVQVAEMGSFIRAAHALGIAARLGVTAVQQLETQLGVRLLHRTHGKCA